MDANPQRRCEWDDDEAEPEPDTIGAASGTAKCHHCGKRIRSTAEGWEHVDTGAIRCDGPPHPDQGNGASGLDAAS